MTEPAKPPTPNFVCPFCGSTTPDQPRCAHCSGPLDPLSRQATQNAMGPWFVRDEQQPFRPGCSYETILTMVVRGKIHADTILRGPSTSQFWYPARRVPGIAHRLASGGVCHSCQQPVTTESECPRCHAVFHADPDRQFLGLMPVRAIPGTPSPAPEVRAASQALAQPSAPAFQLPVPAPMPPRTGEPRSGIAEARAESELAALRQRSAILAVVAGMCAIVALAAIWLLAAGTPGLGGGLGEGRGGAAEAAPGTVMPAPALSGALPAKIGANPGEGGTQPAPAPPESASNPSQPAGPQADLGSQSQPKPPETVSAPTPKAPAGRPSEELTVLRSIRWP